MARTKAYTRQILNNVQNTNARLLDIERKIGKDSQQYERYKNTITASLPEGTFHFTADGRIRINKGKKALASLKVHNFDKIKKLPTAKQSAKQSKKAIAKNQLKAFGYDMPTDEEIEELAEQITDEEALEELAAKAFIEALEDEKGKLKYSDDVKEEMARIGHKTYRKLRAIIEEGYRREAAKNL